MFQSITKAYQYLIFFGAYLKSPLLLLCRLYWGWGFLMAGWGKLQDIDKFAQSLEQMQMFAPHFNAYLGAYVELIGGLFLMIGFASRLVAIPLAIQMVVAYYLAHYEDLVALFGNTSVFVAASPFNYLLISLFVLAFGPGRFSLDYFMEKWLFHRAQATPNHQHLPHD